MFPILRIRAIWLLLGLLLGPWAVQGQWTTQTIVLRPGWNAVFLEVQPEPRECDAVFAGIPIESVWAWNRRFESIQFITDASDLLPGNPDWLTYIPSDNRTLSSLFAVHGGRCYLIKSTASQDFTWRIQGKPVPAVRDWIMGSLNLVGFPVNPASPPAFGPFFSASAAHSGQPIFRLQPSGVWERVASPNATTIRSGEAFWINASQASTYAGLLSVIPEQRTEIDFARVLPETYIHLWNDSPVNRTATITPMDSGPVPPGSEAGFAGPVPLSYWRMDLAAKVYGWYPLDGPISVTIPPRQAIKLRLAIRRGDLAPYTPTPAYKDYTYQGLLQVSDSDGTRVLIPISAKGNTPVPTQGSNRGAGLAADPVVSPHAGLWVGSAVLRGVNQPNHPTDPTAVRPTGSEAQFRLILHVDGSGKARLLQQVMLMRSNAVVDAQGNVVVPGRFVLVTDNARIPLFSGSRLRDGKTIGCRISSVAFSHPRPVEASGTFGKPNFPLSVSLTLPYDDPLNPFKHRFHPDHDNLNAEYTRVLGEGPESYTVMRNITLTFRAEDPDGLARSRFGVDELGGDYSEIIAGIHRHPITVRGTFRLNRVSLIPTLDSIQ